MLLCAANSAALRNAANAYRSAYAEDHDCPPTRLNLAASRTLSNGIAILNYQIARQI
jgi:hypothetical protein